jgi:hypothetical protein
MTLYVDDPRENIKVFLHICSFISSYAFSFFKVCSNTSWISIQPTWGLCSLFLFTSLLFSYLLELPLFLFLYAYLVKKSTIYVYLSSMLLFLVMYIISKFTHALFLFVNWRNKNSKIMEILWKFENFASKFRLFS